MFPFKKKIKEEKTEPIISEDYKSHNKILASPYGIDEIDDNNLILSQNLRLGLNTTQTKRNLNTIYVGGSGSGKTRGFVIPNILQLNSNYVVCEFAGRAYCETKDFLKSQGYIIKNLNLMDPTQSDCYNPFKYIKTEIDIIRISECFAKQIDKGGDPFFSRAEECLMSALIYYMYKTYPRMEWNLEKLLDLFSRSEPAIDELISELPTDSFGYQKYAAYKMGAEAIRKSIMISVLILLQGIKAEFENVLYKDEMNFEDFKKQKVALFVSFPITTAENNCLGNLLIEQLFYYLINNYTIGDEIDDLFLSMHKRKQVETTEKLKLKYHLNFVLDDFCEFNKIEEFEKMLAISRVYDISFLLTVNNLAQIKAKGYDMDSLMANNDTMIFSNFHEENTIRYINYLFGKDIVTPYGPNDPRRLPQDECLIVVREHKPFIDKKFNLKTHKYYEATNEAKGR